VQPEFYDYFQCGILAHGFLRLGCDTCKHEMLLAFSCKRRGFCPSCAGRRMAQTAAHLVERVTPWVPTRQWVVSVPVPLRYWMPRPTRSHAFERGSRYDNARCPIVCTSLRSSLRVCQSVSNRYFMRLNQSLTPQRLSLLSVEAPPRVPEDCNRPMTTVPDV
jgi:hypothetical protein